MANSLYSISTFTYIVVIALILIHDRITHPTLNKLEKEYERLGLGVWLFCLQDMIWGLLAGMQEINYTLFFISSSVFHIATVICTYFWLRFALCYLGDYVTKKRLFMNIYQGIVVFQFAMVITNYIKPVYFTINEEGLYESAFLRPLSFILQYAVYLGVGLGCFLASYSKKGYEKTCLRTLAMFSLPQIIFGIFQIMFTDAPFYAVGYFIGFFLIYLCSVYEERAELRELKQNEFHRKVEEDNKRYNNRADLDELTGLFNRRRYDRILEAVKAEGIEDNLVYVSMDVMGTRKVNDSLGHPAGDEMISGAASCIQHVFDNYGRCFRIGGDEFAAIIYADLEELENVKREVKESLNKWRGKLVDSVEVIFGYAEHQVYSEVDLNELMRIADRNLNIAKINYFTKLGRDRRSGQEIFNAVCASYLKILKVNITTDSYEVIKVNNNEPSFGPSPKYLSEWLNNFGKSDLLAEEDRADFFEKTDLNYISDFFNQKRNSLVLFYFRKLGNHYRKTMMEFFPAENYSEKNQVLYLFVKDIDK